MSSAFTSIQATSEMMEEILPTSVQQVAGLQRATRYQAAATVQGSKRRITRIAKSIDSQALQRMRMHHYWNIMQKADVVELYNERTKQFERINPQAFRDLKIQFDISDGMKGVDKLMLTETMTELYSMVLQSQQGQQRVDFMKMMDHLMSMSGDKTDFNQFAFESPLDALSPDQKQIAFQAYQAAVQQMEAQGGQSNGTGSS